MVSNRAGDDASARSWLDAAQNGRLVLQSCQRCLHIQHPPSALCRSCHSRLSLEWIEHDGHGHLEAATLVHTTPYAERLKDLPFWIASVLLTDGARVMCNLDDVDDAWNPTPGSCVTWSAEKTMTRRSPVFTPAANCARPAETAS